MPTKVENPFKMFTDESGQPLEAGFIFVGEVNKNPEAFPIPIYWDEELVTPAVSPVRTVSGYPSRSGTPAVVYASEGDFSITIKDKNGRLIFSRLSANSLSGLQLDLSNESDPTLGAAIVGRGDQMVSSIADLRALKKDSPSKHAFVSGYYTQGDGGGGMYWLDAADITSADNGGSIIVATDGGRWRLIHDGSVDVAQFGAIQGGDCLAALTAAAAWCRAEGVGLSGSGSYTMSSGPVDLRQIALDCTHMNITTTNASAQIILGNVSTSAYGPKQSLGQLWKSDEIITTDPTVRIIGAKGQIIDIGFTNKIQVYADASIAADTSTAYCVFNINYAYRVEFRTNDTLPDGTVQWINENTFNIKRCVEISIGGTYHHNHNVFNTGTLEGASLIFLSKGSSNLFLCERFENGPAVINFAVGTWANYVLNTWHSNSRSAYEPTTTQFTVADNGIGNMVVRNSDYTMRQNEVLSINSQTCQSFTRNTQNFTTLRGAFASASGQNDFEITVNFQIVLDTGLIPVRLNDGFQAIMDGNKFRCRWMIYSANGAELAATADNTLLLRDGATTNVSGNAYTQNVGVSESVAIVTGSTVGYVRCQIYGNGATGTGQRFKHIGVRSLTQHLFKDGDQRVNRMASRHPAASAIPTVGFAEVGQRVGSTTAAGTEWLCTFSESTFLSASAAGGATTITVTGVGTKAIGDRVGVQLDTGATHWTTLTATAPLTLNVALPSAAAAGNPVCFVRWV